MIPCFRGGTSHNWLSDGTCTDCTATRIADEPASFRCRYPGCYRVQSVPGLCSVHRTTIADESAIAFTPFAQLAFMEACYSAISDVCPREYFWRVYEAGGFADPENPRFVTRGFEPIPNLDCRVWIWNLARQAAHAQS